MKREINIGLLTLIVTTSQSSLSSRREGEEGELFETKREVNNEREINILDYSP